MMDAQQSKVAMITGAVYGIGNAFAHALAREGYDISICDIRPEVEAIAKDMEALYGHRVLGLEADVSKSDDVRSVVDQTMAAFGRIDVLVSNVGIWKATSPTDPWDQALADWDDLINTNLKSAFMFGRAVIPHMIAQGVGNIINVASDHIHNCGTARVSHEDAPDCPFASRSAPGSTSP